jgi:hypothetical protein
MAHPAMTMSDRDQVWIEMCIDSSAVRFVFLIILSYGVVAAIGLNSSDDIDRILTERRSVVPRQIEQVRVASYCRTVFEATRKGDNPRGRVRP